MERSIELVKNFILNKIPCLVIDEKNCSIKDTYKILIGLWAYGFECMLEFKYDDTQEWPKSITLCIPADDICEKYNISSLEDVDSQMMSVVNELKRNDKLDIIIYYERKLERIRKIIEKRF